ncbi:TetR/AcrR family transcriptional regulator [Alkalimarinus coralli]|uniref:TetR/AcrR family transcriptional regulator n=1 Tax=Alkalimarinus coralli TaxID=2935863 RepID=UPI00202B0943|nr:TetR/AcrR family transcriptional regulator [Alkalimarinus coralli]
MEQSAPSSTLKTATAIDKEKRILESALFLFAQRGFHGTAVPEVAKHAEVGAGTIYRYFKNKEDLVNAVFRNSKNKLKQYLLKDIQVNAELRDVFHQFWQQLVSFAWDNPTDFHFLELQDHAPYLDEESKQLELEVLAPIWMFCVQGRKQGVVRDMPEEALIAMIWGAFVGLMKAQTLGYFSISEETLKQAEDTCWNMLTAT